MYFDVLCEGGCCDFEWVVIKFDNERQRYKMEAAVSKLREIIKIS
jgi:hypothetical protein